MWLRLLLLARSSVRLGILRTNERVNDEVPHEAA
jgi:hypothetical protein